MGERDVVGQFKYTLGSRYRARPDNEYGPKTNTGLFIGTFWPNNEYRGLRYRVILAR